MSKDGDWRSLGTSHQILHQHEDRTAILNVLWGKFECVRVWEAWHQKPEGRPIRPQGWERRLSTKTTQKKAVDLLLISLFASNCYSVLFSLWLCLKNHSLGITASIISDCMQFVCVYVSVGYYRTMWAIKKSSSCVLSPPAADQKKKNIRAVRKLFKSAINKQTDGIKMY